MTFRQIATTLFAFWAVTLCGWDSLAQGYAETDNFAVSAPTQEFADRAAKAAEFYREQIAIQWLGDALPGNWSAKCPVKCNVGQIGAGGETRFSFRDGHVVEFRMQVQGTEQRLLDSVIPHEVTHTIFASHFRRPLPRWADEGACTLVESDSERLRQQRLLNQVIRTSKRIPVDRLLSMHEYPKDKGDVLTLYAEGYALTDYLVRYRGKREFVDFLDTAHRNGWQSAFREHYEIADIRSLDQTLVTWLEVNEHRTAKQVERYLR